MPRRAPRTIAPLSGFRPPGPPLCLTREEADKVVEATVTAVHNVSAGRVDR